jgi:hypothetical protein
MERFGGGDRNARRHRRYQPDAPLRPVIEISKDVSAAPASLPAPHSRTRNSCHSTVASSETESTMLAEGTSTS